MSWDLSEKIKNVGGVGGAWDRIILVPNSKQLLNFW